MKIDNPSPALRRKIDWDILSLRIGSIEKKKHEKGWKSMKCEYGKERDHSISFSTGFGIDELYSELAGFID